MAYNPTQWKDRIIEKPNTFRMQNNADGTVTLIPVPGQVTQAGTPVNSVNLNKIENELVNVNSSLNDNVQQLNGTVVSKQFSKGALVFHFDDGNSSIYNNAYPLFLAKNIPACCAINVYDWLQQDRNGKMTLAQLQELQGKGWEILSHTMTHTTLTNSVPKDQVEWELKESYNHLTKYGFNVKAFASPNSSFPTDDASINILKQTYAGAFTQYVDSSTATISQMVHTYPVDIYNMHRASMNGRTLEQMKAWMDYIETNKCLLVLYEHNIGTAGYLDTATLSSLLDYIATKNIDVVTTTEAIKRVSTAIVSNEKVQKIKDDVIQIKNSSASENLLANPKFYGITTPFGWTFQQGGTGISGGMTTSIIKGTPANYFQIALDNTNTLDSDTLILQQDYPINLFPYPTPYCFSIFAKATGANRTIKIRMSLMNGANVYRNYEQEYNLTSQYRQYPISAILNDDVVFTSIKVVVYLYNKAINNAVTFTLHRPQLENSLKPSQFKVPSKLINCAFSVDITSSQTNVASGVWTKVLFTRENYDKLGCYDLINNKFIAPCKGTYLLNSAVQYTAGAEGTRYMMAIYKNGVSYYASTNASSGTAQQGSSISTIVDANEGDYFEIYVWQASGSAQTIAGSPYTWFTGALINES